MDPTCHNFDVEARDPDKSRYPLGAGTTLAASLGAEIGQASGPASLLCPGGVAAQPPVRDQGPHVSGERSRLEISEQGTDFTAGDEVSPPASNQLGSELRAARAIGSGICSVLDSNLPPPHGSIATPSRGTTNSQTAVVGQRVDALVVAFALTLSPAIRDEILQRQSIADVAGTAELVISKLSFAMKMSRQRDTFRFENADLRGSFNERAAGGWQLEVIVRAVYLATHCLTDVIVLTKRVAEGFGSIKAARLRRFDLAVDAIWFPLTKDDIDRILTRARIDAFIAQSKDFDEVGGEFCKPALREHHSPNHAITGFSIAQGNPLMARMYDKTRELAQPGREEKRAIEFEIWRQSGWNGKDSVTRVEFQHRGQFLDDIDQRNIDVLRDSLDAVWQFDVNWLRLVDPTSATRLCRCVLDARWIPIAEVVFVHRAQPVARKRLRGGATATHLLGAALSHQAASGRLTHIELGVSEDGEFLNEETFAARMTADAARAWLDRYVSSTFGEAARDVARSLRRNADPRDAVAQFIAKRNSAVARFSSVDDESTPPNPANEGEDS